ncbi:hypothetical protein B0H16DRAFT_1734325 [Mycena metata]|uniref:Uncharacterized protein n=1 Tax=Mycena metata TaxID=1033252 RepID=A0AAD7HVC4_9AGAR|nr:hypothetical protein B0H16DRAFT_1734325 [Mycena metata]
MAFAFKDDVPNKECFASLTLSAALATTAFAQTISIQAPVDGTTSSSSDLVQVALAIGLSIPNLAPAIGDTILYNGPFNPQVGTVQNFIVTIPADTPAGLMSLNVAHFDLIGMRTLLLISD